MRLSLLIAFVFATSLTQAQITLNSADFPSANDMYLMSDATAFTGMDATLTGANYNWDYSLLSTTTTGQHTDTFFTVTNMNIIYQAVFGDFGFLPNRSNQATHGMDVSFGALTITNVFNFFYNNSNDYHQSGFGAEINGVPAPTAYSPHDILYRFPMQFGNADSSLSGYSVSLPNILYYSVNRNRVNVVDGWGTVITPNGTFNALRIKTTIQEHDSVFLDTLGFGYGFNLPLRTEYKWLSPGGGLPILQVDVVNGVVSSVIYKGENTSGIEDMKSAATDLIVFPNPVKDKVFMQYFLPVTDDVVFSITATDGRVISSLIQTKRNAGEHIQVMDIPTGISAGNYFVKMTNGNQSITKSITVVR